MSTAQPPGNESDKLWGDQTSSSLKYFNIGEDLFDHHFIKSLLLVKRSMALANSSYELLDSQKSDLIVRAVELIMESDLDSYFPVKIWQTGSGTQINMNANEVISKLATRLSDYKIEVHANDHVNMSQSSNDVIPTALKVSSLSLLRAGLVPELEKLSQEFSRKEDEFSSIYKVARTHLMDAVPITLGQEFSAFKKQIDLSISSLKNIMSNLMNLPLGGTAVGTGINCPREVSILAINHLCKEFNFKFKQSDNLFIETSGNHDVLELNSSLKNLACALLKISTDIAYLSSGPETGFNELELPQNEAGSSIMPGKVNPTQCEVVQMVCCEVIGNELSVSLGEMQGRFQLSSFRPLIIKNTICSIKLLNDSILSFRQYCLVGLSVNHKKIRENLESNMMIGTLFAPSFGYDKVQELVEKARTNKSSFKDEIIKEGLISKEDFENKLSSESIVSPPNINGHK